MQIVKWQLPPKNLQSGFSTNPVQATSAVTFPCTFVCLQYQPRTKGREGKISFNLPCLSLSHSHLCHAPFVPFSRGTHLQLLQLRPPSLCLWAWLRHGRMSYRLARTKLALTFLWLPRGQTDWKNRWVN